LAALHFLNIFLFAAPLLSRFTHPPPPISKEIYTSCWEGVGIAQRKIDQFNISEKIKGKDDFLSAI
jgi:hypothetical protein